MRDTRVAARYAKSLLELSLEQGNTEAVHEDMRLLLDTCRSTREFANLLKSPIVSTDKKAAIIREVFTGSISKLSFAFIEILVNKGRESYLEAIAAEFLNQYKTHNNIVTAKVTTATPLDNSTRTKIIDLVKKRTGSGVDLIETVDPEVIGGFILKIGDEQIDSSIAGRLDALRSEFSKNPYVKEY